jgi:hypothetical protein
MAAMHVQVSPTPGAVVGALVAAGRLSHSAAAQRLQGTLLVAGGSGGFAGARGTIAVAGYGAPSAADTNLVALSVTLPARPQGM